MIPRVEILQERLVRGDVLELILVFVFPFFSFPFLCPRRKQMFGMFELLDTNKSSNWSIYENTPFPSKLTQVLC